MSEELLDYRLKQMEEKFEAEKKVLFDKHREIAKRVAILEKSGVFVKGAVWLLTILSSIFAFAWSQK